jgi:hypothetical protein|tara:strand:- start:320 stop:544 length:225 start_codon:yes stop_codon:yes gene_type:complete
MKIVKMPQTIVKWGHEDVTILELFKELDKLVCDPVRNMQEMDTEMYVSDYQKLSQAFWRISNTLELLKKKYNDV